MTPGEASTQARGILTGTPGFSKPHWKGLLYPRDLRNENLLAFYAAHLPMVELDTTFYGAPPAGRVLGWRDQTPEHFVLSAKVPQAITHEGALGSEATLSQIAQFFETMRLLGPRLGPLCFQLPPRFAYPRGVAELEAMLRALPTLGADGLDLCIEFRHPSWIAHDTKRQTEALLSQNGVAWVWNDWAPLQPSFPPLVRAIDDPRAFRVTSDRFAYIRLIGSHEAESSQHTTAVDRSDDLARWAALVNDFRAGRPDRSVYIVTSDHYSDTGLRAIATLRRHLGLPDLPVLARLEQAPPPEPEPVQLELTGL